MPHITTDQSTELNTSPSSLCALSHLPQIAAFFSVPMRAGTHWMRTRPAPFRAASAREFGSLGVAPCPPTCAEEHRHRVQDGRNHASRVNGASERWLYYVALLCSLVDALGYSLSFPSTGPCLSACHQRLSLCSRHSSVPCQALQGWPSCGWGVCVGSAFCFWVKSLP